MKVAMDSECFFATFTGAATANQGATAGVKSASFNLGSITAPVNLAGATAAISLITAMASVLDEQNIPESDRFLLIDPVTRQALMNSNLQQAYLTGDSQSILRNGKIGSGPLRGVRHQQPKPALLLVRSDLRRFADQVAGALQPRRTASSSPATSAITFASQFTKTEISQS